MNRSGQESLLICALADLMLYRAFQAPSAQSALLAFPAAAAVGMLLCGALRRWGLSAQQNVLYPALLMGYAAISCVQLYCLFEKTEADPLGRLWKPILLLGFAAVLPGKTQEAFSVSARLLLWGAGAAGVLFLLAAMPNMYLSALSVQTGRELRQSAAAALCSLSLPLPEYVMLTDSSLQKLPNKPVWLPVQLCALQAPVQLCALQALLQLMVELTFGRQGTEFTLGGYETAQIGVLFSLKRLEALQIAIWLCLLIYRMQFITALLLNRTKKREKTIFAIVASAVVYLVLVLTVQNRTWIFAGYECLVVLAICISLAGGKYRCKTK